MPNTPLLQYSITPFPLSRQDRFNELNDFLTQIDITPHRDVPISHVFLGYEDVLHMILRHIAAQTGKTGGLAPLELTLRRKKIVDVNAQRIWMRRIAHDDQRPIACGDVGAFFQSFGMEVL